MKIIKTINNMLKEINRIKRAGQTIGFVPTMGCLHDGHASLLRAARKENDELIMSLFVNPIQFGPKEDLRRYPRDFKRDKAIALKEKVDIIFYPVAKEMYPSGFETYVEVEGVSEGLCGARRPGHFKGAATVVTKFFNIIHPDLAYFGQKDAQQAVVIRQMVKDLNMPLKIKVLPTVRERDGLAMSSRNRYLNNEERRAAAILYRSIKEAKDMVKDGIIRAAAIRRKMAGLIRKEKLARLDYLEIVDKDSLKKIKEAKKGHILIALAVYIGKTRLIDNIVI